MDRKIAFISLGCDKNRVDSEVMLGLLSEAGFTISADESDADIIVINTCCFIKDALEESIETIIETAEHKKSGVCKGIIVTGCLGQRYENEIFEELPEVDAVVGSTAYEDIAQIAKRIIDGEKHIKHMSPINRIAQNDLSEKRIISTAGYYAYLKISEGCDNHCTYCVIPYLRGKHRSRSIESLLKEAENLAESGVKELIIVAQDTSIYGKDLYGKPCLDVLLKKLCGIDGIQWIRLLYCYTETLTQEVIDVMASEAKICHYIDMPIQHSSDNVLKRMGRKSSRSILEQKINALRNAIPDIAIRTSIIVGFPGETEAEFDELCNFIYESKLDRVGVFTYSQEEGTPAAEMDDQIDEEVKNKRREILMEYQKNVSAEKCQSEIGKSISVIVEGYIPDEGIYCARSYKDAPDVDGIVFVKSDYEIMSGDIVNIVVTGAGDYDITGEVI